MWMAVAKKEYLENVRNAWVIVVTVAFLALTLIASASASVWGMVDGSAGTGFADIVLTLAAMQNVSGFLIPILAVVLAFGTVAGERESGSLALLAAQPISRGEILAGKWVGLWGVMATAILAGFGLGGILVLTNTTTNTGGLGVQILLVFLMATLAWGAAWISLTLFLSAFFDRRGTAIAGSIGAWFIFGRFVWNMLTIMLVLLLANDVLSSFMNGTGAPRWLIITQLLNPNSVYDGLLATSIEGFPSIIGLAGETLLPGLYTVYVFSLAMVAWIALPYIGANALFARKDI